MLVGKVQDLSKQIIIPSVRLFSSSSSQPDSGPSIIHLVQTSENQNTVELEDDF